MFEITGSLNIMKWCWEWNGRVALTVVSEGRFGSYRVQSSIRKVIPEYFILSLWILQVNCLLYWIYKISICETLKHKENRFIEIKVLWNVPSSCPGTCLPTFFHKVLSPFISLIRYYSSTKQQDVTSQTTVTFIFCRKKILPPVSCPLSFAMHGVSG